MKFFNCWSLFLIVACSVAFGENIPKSEILASVESELPHLGVLRSLDRFVYVDVDDAYIHTLIDFIQKDGFEEPPYFGKGLSGAHISVIDVAEMEAFSIHEIEELGKTIHFIPKACEVVHPPNWRGIEKVCFIVVEAPELDKIREKYGLPKRRYAFHITIGVKPAMAQAAGL